MLNILSRVKASREFKNDCIGFLQEHEFDLDNEKEIEQGLKRFMSNYILNTLLFFIPNNLLDLVLEKLDN